jgi:hypothetical protein
VEYVKVESSQIAEVGYGEGHYGPETLGIRFKNKSGITEYHYGGVRHDMYVAFIEAESVGIFFKDYIKPFPNQYPFTKVEVDPTEPVPEKAPRNTGSEQTSNGSSTNLPDGTDIPSPGTALALIDRMADDKLFSPGSITDAQLATMRSDWLAEAKKYDISSESKRTELKRFARPLQKLRTGIEARAKELTGATKRKIAAIDAEKRRLVQVVGGIEDEVLAPLTEWENEDKVRVARLERTLLDINAMQPHVYADIDALILAIAQLNAIDADAMQEFKTLATQAKARALVALTGDLVRRQEVEAQRLELERLRAESAARAEADRQVEAKRQEDARIAAAVEAAKVATRQEVIAELAAPVVEEIVIPAAVPVVIEREREREAFIETHEQRINAQAVAAFIGHCGYTRQQAIAGLTAITKGLIPHVSITY